MDSGDDIHGVSDGDTVDDYYSDGGSMNDDYDEGGYIDHGDEDEEGYIDDSAETTSHQKSYRVLSGEDIRKHQEEDISSVSDVLSLSRDSASILLRNYNWSVANMNDAWFADEERVPETLGLLEEPVVCYPKDMKLNCGICFEDYVRDSMCAAACGHPFCSKCWKKYINISIKDGPGCLNLRCPEPSCLAAVGQDMVNELVHDGNKEKYARYLFRSYIEANRKTKWCPAPGCDNAVEFEFVSGCFDVTCNCSYSFCWNCTEESHRPVECDTVAKWIIKNSAESENTNWIIANCKACPKCHRPIDKNLGCMHMTCTPPCNYEFCWLCLRSWKFHNDDTGGFFECNIYAEARKERKYDAVERRRERAKNAIDRYTHYYERWAANQTSKLKAVKDLEQMQAGHIMNLSNIQCQTESQLKFITDAWIQIIECRRVLRWTYAYGYYITEAERSKKRLFEYLQGEAESNLERLHQCAEKDLQQYRDAKEPSGDFDEFRTRLVDLTVVTRNYFENLTRALENDLADVDSEVTFRKLGQRKNLLDEEGEDIFCLRNMFDHIVS